MSDDLISRSAVIKEINEYMKSAYDCDIESVSDFQRGNESKQSYIVEGLYEAFELIGNVPTTYDVDKVVGQLEECKRIMESPVQQDCYGKECRVGDCIVCAFDKALDIVKAGGANG